MPPRSGQLLFQISWQKTLPPNLKDKVGWPITTRVDKWIISPSRIQSQPVNLSRKEESFGPSWLLYIVGKTFA